MSQQPQTLGEELRAIANKANHVLLENHHQNKLDTMRRVVTDVIIPGIRQSKLAETGKYEMYFPNKTCGWDYLWFTYNDSTKNKFMLALEAELEKHGLSVRYNVDGAINHWDRDSIEGIYVCWRG